MTKDEAKEKIINDFCRCRVWCELYPDMCQTESCEIWWALKALSERPTGEWTWQLADNGWVDHICSVCGYTENTDIHVSLGWKYCPNCGAKMEGADDEND